MSLLSLHDATCWFQIPDAWQVLELDPSKLYPRIHVNVATVSTGYCPLTSSWSKLTWPFERYRSSHNTVNINVVEK